VTASPPGEETLLEVVHALAPIERRAGEDGERQAAEWIAERLCAAGCAAEVQDELFLDGYAEVMRALSAAGLGAGVAALATGPGPLRRVAGLAAAAVTAAIADDVSNAALVSSKDSSVPYLDWATPSLLTTIQTKSQDLMAGKASVTDVIKAAQADDAAFQAKLAK